MLPTAFPSGRRPILGVFDVSTLSSSSTDAQVLAAYDDAASWFEDSDVTKAKSLVTAGGILLRRRPKRVSLGGEEIELDLEGIRQDVRLARKFVNARTTAAAGGSGVTYVGLEDFRK